MKKKIIGILALCVLVVFLTGCSPTTYEDAATPAYKNYGGYFYVAKEWYDSDLGDCKILYAADTKVMYFYFDGNYTSGLTPLFNADGTLQIYGGP